MINFKTLMASVLLAGMATQATFAQESGEKKKADYPTSLLAYRVAVK